MGSGGSVSGTVYNLREANLLAGGGDQTVRNLMPRGPAGTKIEQVFDLEDDGLAQYPFKRSALLVEHDGQRAAFLLHAALDVTRARAGNGLTPSA